MAQRQWTPRYALCAYVVTLVLDFGLVAVLTRAELRLGLGVLAIDLAMLATLVPLLGSGRLSGRDLGFRTTSAPHAVGMVLAAIVVYLLLAAAWTAAVIGPLRHKAVPQLDEGTAGTIIAGFAMCVSAPVVEEIFFRGLLYRALRNRLRVTWSALLVGVLFGVVHGSTYPLDTLPIKFVFGVIACLLYEWSGSLWPSIALHSLIDSVGFEASISHGKLLFVGLAFLALALGLLLWHRLRPATEQQLASPRQRHGDDLPGRAADAIIVLAGGRSPRRLLGYAGLAAIVIAIVFSIAGPDHGRPHTTGGSITGFVLLVGLVCLVSAVGWKLFGRRRGPRR